MVNLEYKKFACVKELKEYKERFCKIAEHYGEQLNKKIIIDDSVYTLHDFDFHCMDLYKIISEVLLDANRAYSGGLTEKELYILDLAVLFHDISMSNDVLTERNNHSKMSADYIQEIYNDIHSFFYTECQLNANEIKALKAVILAHSDVKDGTIPPENRGLKDPYLTDSMPAKNGFIRGKLLAGILRLADELDITNERLGNTNIEQNLKAAREKNTTLEMKVESGEGGDELRDKLKKYKEYVESLGYWEKLHLFTQVYRECQDDTIYLITDDEYLQLLIDRGDKASVLARRILSVYEKIEKEWAEIKQTVIDSSLKKLDIKSFFPVTVIKIKCGINSVKQELDKQLNNVMTVKEVDKSDVSSNDAGKNDIKDKTKNRDEKKHIQIIDKALSDRLTQEIRRRHLLKVGHFLLDDYFCARDWIDIKEILETKIITNSIVECLVNHIRYNQKTLIVGLDLEGALLASRVAMGIKRPFSYIIPVKEHSNSSTKEYEISIKEYDDVILFTDAIVTFDTIKKALNEIEISNNLTKEQLMGKISYIYSIFYRESDCLELKKNSELLEKTYCLNMDFPVELFKKEECHYVIEGQCLALNNRQKVM